MESFSLRTSASLSELFSVMSLNLEGVIRQFLTTALLPLLSLLLRLGALSLSLLVSSRIWVRRFSFLNNLKVAASLNFAECVFNDSKLSLRDDLSFSEF